MAQARRILAVTLGLVGLGAVAGAVCGVLIPVGVVLLTGRYGDVPAPGLGLLATLGAGFGALVGGVAGPAVAWGLLRRVPLGRAALWSAVGTVAGALVGELLAPFNPYSRVMPGVIACGIVGFLIASTGLRLHSGRAARRAPVREPPNVGEP